MRINVFGLCRGDSGFAQHTRQFAAALARLEDVVLVPWDSRRGEGPQPWADAQVGIGIGPIERMGEIVGGERVGFAVWETTTLPERKLRALMALDQVWVPSRWGRDVLVDNGLPAERVHVVPEGVDASVFRPAAARDEGSGREGSERPARPFRFLCVGKWEERKGIDDLAQAFAREFEPTEPVELILHCFNPYLPEFDFAAALQRLSLPAHAPIRFSIPVELGRLVQLYLESDVLVQPTRAEGWGLPILEAMACGIPAIATNYSAHTAFLNDGNGYLVDVAGMVRVADAFFYGAEDLGFWAQPDVDHLRKLMRRAFEETEERRLKGLRARRDVEAGWTWDHAARIAQRRLYG